MELDADDDLPWPHLEGVKDWWVKNSRRFPTGARHFLGRPISSDQLKDVLKHGRQRQWAAAAIELSMRAPGTPLFKVRGSAYRQLKAVQSLEPPCRSSYDKPQADDWKAEMMRQVEEAPWESAKRWRATPERRHGALCENVWRQIIEKSACALRDCCIPNIESGPVVDIHHIDYKRIAAL